jgi:hypothetical protein
MRFARIKDRQVRARSQRSALAFDRAVFHRRGRQPGDKVDRLAGEFEECIRRCAAADAYLDTEWLADDVELSEVSQLKKHFVARSVCEHGAGFTHQIRGARVALAIAADAARRPASKTLTASLMFCFLSAEACYLSTRAM